MEETRGATAGGARDAGITLVEVAVSTAVMAVAMAIFTTGIVQIYRAVSTVDALSTAQTHLMTAFRRLDHEVRYATAISKPANSSTISSVEYVLATAAGATCVQLKLDAAAGRLSRRSWLKDDDPVTPTPWQLLVSSVRPTTPAPAGMSGTPFDVRNGDAKFTSPTLTVALTVTGGTGTTRQSAVTLSALNAPAELTKDPVCPEGRSIP